MHYFFSYFMRKNIFFRLLFSPVLHFDQEMIRKLIIHVEFMWVGRCLIIFLRFYIFIPYFPLYSFFSFILHVLHYQPTCWIHVGYLGFFLFFLFSFFAFQIFTLFFSLFLFSFILHVLHHHPRCKLIMNLRSFFQPPRTTFLAGQVVIKDKILTFIHLLASLPSLCLWRVHFFSPLSQTPHFVQFLVSFTRFSQVIWCCRTQYDLAKGPHSATLHSTSLCLS